jgi:hypothetical protein
VWSILHSVHLNVSKATITTDNFVACVIRERETEREHTAGKDTASVAGRLPLYPMEMTESCKILLVASLFSCRGRRNSELLHLVVGVVASRLFQGAYHLLLQGCEAVN